MAKEKQTGSVRLDRFLAEMGAGTRSQIREMAKKGRICVNGEVEKRVERKIDPASEEVSLDGRKISYVEYEYYMLNKPKGVVSATEDGRRQTVIGLIDSRKRKDLFPVGRLDLDTEGLLLITNDGELAHRLLSPKKHVDKRYLAVVEGQLPEDAAARFSSGILLEDGTRTLPARLEEAESARPETGAEAEAAAGAENRGPARRTVLVTVHEGKFHQIKRMFEALGCRVTELKRLSMGSLKLDERLQPGQYRPLTEEEIRALRSWESDSDKAGEEPARQEKTMLKDKKAIIFDLDGTLVDSMWMWKAIDLEFLGRYGLACPPDLQRTIEGMSFTETAAYFIRRFRLPLTMDEVKAIWTEMSIDKYRREVPVKPGALQLLKYAKEHGIRCGIATSNGAEMVDAVLTATGIRDYFRVVTTACEVKEGKPSPDIYLKVADSLGVAPGDCLVFEDVPAGILAGKRAGMTVCAVADAAADHMRGEVAALADYFIEDFRELFPEKESGSEESGPDAGERPQSPGVGETG